MRGGADGLSIAVPFADAELLHVAPDDRDSAARLDVGDTRASNLDRFFMFPQAMAGGRRPEPAVSCRRSRRRICSSCTRPDSSTSRARTSTRSATWKSANPSIRRSSRVARAPSGEHSAAQARRRRCAASASRTACRKRSSARRDAADRRSDELHDRRLGDDAGGAHRVPAGRLRRRRRAAALRGARRDEHVDLLKSVNFTGYVPANGAVYPNTARSAARCGPSRC